MLASTFYLIIGGVLGAIAVGGGGVGIWAAATKDSRARKRLFGQYVPKRDRTLPERVDAELLGLSEDLKVLLELEQYQLAEKVGKVIELAQEFFRRLKKADDPHRVNMAAVNYSDVLAKLNQALSDDYYFDLIRNPDMWTRVKERKELVEGTANAIIWELTQAIRDFNSSADIHYDLNLESVLRRADATAILDDLR